MHSLLTSNTHTSAYLGLSQAIALLSATEEVKTDVIEKIESGEKVTIAEINRKNSRHRFMAGYLLRQD